MEQELIHNMGVDEVTASKWTTGVRTINSSVTSVGDVLSSVTQGRAEAMCFRQGISIQSLAIIKIFLGTPASPAEFGKDTDQDKENDVAVGRGKAKGGGMREASEILAARREKMTPGSYYPPVCFDGHRIDSPSRNMDHLRKLVVQEIHTVCGHLYPEDNERNVILDAITSHCLFVRSLCDLSGTSLGLAHDLVQLQSPLGCVVGFVLLLRRFFNCNCNCPPLQPLLRHWPLELLEGQFRQAKEAQGHRNQRY